MEINEDLLKDIETHSNNFLLKKYDELTTKKIYENISNNGYLKVYDCGTLKYKISLHN